MCLFAASPAMQTALRLQSEAETSLQHQLKLKRRVQREHGQRERSRSARSSRSSQSDDTCMQEMEKMEKEKDRQDSEIECILQVCESRWKSVGETIEQVFLNPLPPFFKSVLQQARELEHHRRQAEEKERRKHMEVQMELERQLKEAEMVKDGRAYL